MNFKTKVEKVGNNIIVDSEDALILSDDYYNWTSMSENANEKYVLEVFQKIQKLNRFDIKSNLSVINLIKSLNEYEKATNEYSRLFIFKHLFNALELAINFGRESTGKDFDKTVQALTGIHEGSVQRWRDFYNRVKHVNKSNQHNVTHVEGTKNISSILVPIRDSCKKAIMMLLNKSTIG
jgi:hypothetical protein